MTTTQSTGSKLIDALAADVLSAGGTITRDGNETRWEFTVPRMTLNCGTGETRPVQWNAGSAGYYLRDGRRQVSGIAQVRQTMSAWRVAA